MTLVSDRMATANLFTPTPCVSRCASFTKFETAMQDVRVSISKDAPRITFGRAIPRKRDQPVESELRGPVGIVQSRPVRVPMNAVSGRKPPWRRKKLNKSTMSPFVASPRRTST